MKIERALLSLRPGAEWVVRGSHIEWLDQFQTQPTEEEIETKLAELRTAEPIRLLREERDRRIAETDWWVLPDRTASQEQKDYRQALRDITETQTPTLDENGQLTNVTWPTKPT